MSIPDRLGDFKIVEEIGRGGFGIVYRAHQCSLDRPVALKVLYRHLIHTEDQVARFEREARATARLNHPAIVPVFAWGEEQDSFYLAQRLIGNGRTLADELIDMRKDADPPKGWFRRMAKMLANTADGLQQAHERGIVHRDVKPSNILMDEDRQPFLSDFGLAKVEDGLELSRTGDFAGSPYYMSPEQADGRRGPVDHRSDIYSLGVTMYEMLALALPFLGTNSHEIIRKILNEEPKPPSKVQARIPADLETICLHAMEKNPDRRYQSAEEFAADLRAFLEGEPILAVPVGAATKLLRRMKRHRAAIGLLVLGSVVIVGGAWVYDQSRAIKAADVARTVVQQVQARDKERIESQFDPQIQRLKEQGLYAQALSETEEKNRQLEEAGKSADMFFDLISSMQRDRDQGGLAQVGKLLRQAGGSMSGATAIVLSQLDVKLPQELLADLPEVSGRTPGLQPDSPAGTGEPAPKSD